MISLPCRPLPCSYHLCSSDARSRLTRYLFSPYTHILDLEVKEAEANAVRRSGMRPREMGCEGKDIRPEFLMASASRRSWSVRSPFVTLHLPFPTRSEASGRDERSGMEGRVTGCGWNGFFGRLSSCPYHPLLIPSLASLIPPHVTHSFRRSTSPRPPSSSGPA